MKYTTAIFALFAQANATTNFQVSVDEAEAMRTSQAIAQRVMSWGQSNQDDLTTAAMSVKSIVEQFLDQKMAYGGAKWGGVSVFADALTKMAFADPEACDEETFAQCLIDTNEIDLMRMMSGQSQEVNLREGPPEMALWMVFTTQCAVDSGCTAPCFNQEYNDMDYSGTYEERRAARNTTGKVCKDLQSVADDAGYQAYQAKRNVSRAMEQVIMGEFQANQETAMNLAQQFGELADGVLEDFGCSEDCFEECAIERTTYNGQTFTSLKTDQEIMECSVYTCCTAVDIVSFDVTQTNMQCSFNNAKKVQCFTADL